MEEVIGVRVLGELRGHRADDTELVGALADVGKQVAHGQAALAVAVELPRTAEGGAVVVELDRLHRQREGPAVFTIQARLGIEGVHL